MNSIRSHSLSGFETNFFFNEEKTLSRGLFDLLWESDSLLPSSYVIKNVSHLTNQQIAQEFFTSNASESYNHLPAIAHRGFAAVARVVILVAGRALLPVLGLTYHTISAGSHYFAGNRAALEAQAQLAFSELLRGIFFYYMPLVDILSAIYNPLCCFSDLFEENILQNNQTQSDWAKERMARGLRFETGLSIPANRIEEVYETIKTSYRERVIALFKQLKETLPGDVLSSRSDKNLSLRTTLHYIEQSRVEWENGPLKDDIIRLRNELIEIHKKYTALVKYRVAEFDTWGQLYLGGNCLVNDQEAVQDVFAPKSTVKPNLLKDLGIRSLTEQMFSAILSSDLLLPSKVTSLLKLENKATLQLSIEEVDLFDKRALRKEDSILVQVARKTARFFVMAFVFPPTSTIGCLYHGAQLARYTISSAMSNEEAKHTQSQYIKAHAFAFFQDLIGLSHLPALVLFELFESDPIELLKDAFLEQTALTTSFLLKKHFGAVDKSGWLLSYNHYEDNYKCSDIKVLLKTERSAAKTFVWFKAYQNPLFLQMRAQKATELFSFIKQTSKNLDQRKTLLLSNAFYAFVENENSDELLAFFRSEGLTQDNAAGLQKMCEELLELRDILQENAKLTKTFPNYANLSKSWFKVYPYAFKGFDNPSANSSYENPFSNRQNDPFAIELNTIRQQIREFNLGPASNEDETYRTFLEKVLSDSPCSAADLLGIRSDQPLTSQLIDKRYRSLALKVHPDKVPARKLEATELFKLLGIAKASLKSD